MAPDTRALSTFLKVEHVQDGDVITFIDAGEIKEKTFDQGNRKEVKQVLEIGIKFYGEKKLYSPNATTIKLLNEAWGTDTNNWVGKQAVITVLPSPNGRPMIICKPKPATAKEQIMARQPEVDSKDVPF